MPRRITVGDFRFTALEKRYIGQVIRSNRVSYGPFSEKFEAAFARAHGCRRAVFLNSGTSALHIALAALKEKRGWKDGDEVIVPAVTFIATANIVLHNNMTPVFADVDPFDYTLSPREFEKRVTRRTRAVIPVHLTGLPADMEAISSVARARRLAVIEDSCETLFAKCAGRSVGSWGDIGCFSTYMAHYIVTGVGGLATTNDDDLAVRLRSLMNHGRDSIYFHIDSAKGKKGKSLHEVVARRFRFVSLGHSFRATEFEAAMGLAQIERKDEIIRLRLRNARRLSENLKDLAEHVQLPTVPPGREHMFMMYPLIVNKGPKARLVNFLEDAGIETRDLLPLINQPVYRRIFGDLEGRYPVARRINRGGFYVGCHPYLSLEDMDFISARVRAFFKRGLAGRRA